MEDSKTSDIPRFKNAFPYQDDVLALPVKDLDSASRWYCKSFGMVEVERRDTPNPTVILERDGTRIGFSINGNDATQDGAAILVSGITLVKEELEANGVEIGNWRIDEREGQKYQVFLSWRQMGSAFIFMSPLARIAFEEKGGLLRSNNVRT